MSGVGLAWLFLLWIFGAFAVLDEDFLVPDCAAVLGVEAEGPEGEVLLAALGADGGGQVDAAVR